MSSIADVVNKIERLNARVETLKNNNERDIASVLSKLTPKIDQIKKIHTNLKRCIEICNEDRAELERRLRRVGAASQSSQSSLGDSSASSQVSLNQGQIYEITTALERLNASMRKLEGINLTDLNQAVDNLGNEITSLDEAASKCAERGSSSSGVPRGPSGAPGPGASRHGFIKPHQPIPVQQLKNLRVPNTQAPAQRHVQRPWQQGTDINPQVSLPPKNGGRKRHSTHKRRRFPRRRFSRKY